MGRNHEVLETIAWFDELGLTDTATVGGKGANLGELIRAGLPVPPGFVVTTAAYERAIEAAGVRDELRTLFAEACRQADEPAALAAASARLQELVRKAGTPPDVSDAVLAAYHRLGVEVPVAVRSSATAEDTAGTSFAGMHETFANVVGDAALLERLVDCWSSLYGERVIAYRASQGLTEEPALAVVVQRMVASERAGVLFTADPSTGDRDRLVIEGAFGLGEVVVSGDVEPDTYVVAKDGPQLLSVRVGHKTHKLVGGPGGSIVRVELEGGEADERVLNDHEQLALAHLGMQVESHYGEPQDIEWAMADGETFLVQSRPITTLGHAPAPRSDSSPAVGRLLVRGLAASTGAASGRVRVLVSPKDGNQLEPGEVLVAQMTNPDWVPTIRRAAAVVTDGGGMTCHAAIVTRELGVPCVVGTHNATSTLHDGELVTVDGAEGAVYEGERRRDVKDGPRALEVEASPAVVVGEALATRIYVNLAIADRAEQVAVQPVDGVGLLRARVHGHRRPRWGAPTRALGQGRTGRVPDPHVRLAAADHPSIRTAPGRVPDHRLPHERVPRARRR